MEKTNNPAATTIPIVVLDTDVIINWLAEEENLWKAPHSLIEFMEKGRLRANLTLLSIMEIRFVLRRKKGLKEERIKEDIAELLGLFDILVPDEISLLGANRLQNDFPFSPFDALLVACASTVNATLISRDKTLLQLASPFVPAATPEEFLEKVK
jgi:predicted nucleic acid-binding protein